MRRAWSRNVREQEASARVREDQLMADTMVLTDEGLRHLVAEMGISQVVYGTDTAESPRELGIGSRELSPAIRVSS